MIAETLRIDQLRVADGNPRRGVGDVRELAASIKSIGILHPLVVTPVGANYVVVAGSRRLAAAKLAGLQEVPVVVRTFDAAQMQEATLVENLHREALAPVEEAMALSLLCSGRGDNGVITQRSVAKRIGKTQAWVSQRLSLLDLPAFALEALDEQKITIEQARDLAKAADRPEIVEDAFDRITHSTGISAPAAIKEAERRAEIRVALEARRAELTDAGVRVLTDEDEGPEQHYERVWGHEVAEHESQPCHAIILGIGYDRVREEPVCTAPDSHDEVLPAPTAAAAEKAAERKRVELAVERKILELATETRLAACQEICRRMPSKETAALLEWALVAPCCPERYDVEARTVAKILELDIPTGEDGEVDAAWLDDAETSLRDYAAGSDRARQRAALAWALADVEDAIGAGWLADWSGPTVARHFVALATVGYEPVEAERRRLGTSAASV